MRLIFILNVIFIFSNIVFAYQFEVGKHTYGSESIRILDWGEGANIRIGKFCSIAVGCTIFLGGNHRIDWVTTYPFPAFINTWPEAKDILGHPSTKGDVIIGNDVWIGYNVTILSGIKIGDGAVVGACTLVSKDVPAYAIVVGNPAKIVKYRFSEKIIQNFLKLKWWDWSDEKIKKNMKFLCSNNFEIIFENL